MGRQSDMMAAAKAEIVPMAKVGPHSTKPSPQNISPNTIDDIAKTNPNAADTPAPRQPR